MDTISSRIKKALETRGLKQIDLAEMTNIGKSSISTYISGRYEPKQKNIHKIAKALSVSESWLLGHNVPMDGFDYDYSIVEVPIFTSAIAAGFPDEIEDVRSLSDLDKIKVPVDFFGRNSRYISTIAAMKVNGDSMNRIIPDRSYVFVRIDLRIDSMKNGDLVVFRYNGEYSLKHYYRDQPNRRILFKPDSTNPSFTDIIVPFDTAEDLQILGKVILYTVEPSEPS